MSRHISHARAGHDRASLYTEITDKIIAELEVGRVPWVQPWGTAAVKAPLAMPRNATTQRRYSGINILILWGAVIERGFAGQSWLTFRQALGLGGHVRKGERGTTVVYADRFTPEDERRRAAETGEEPGAITFLKRFTVFNTDQCDGLPEHVAASVVPPSPGQIEPRAEALIAATGADFRIGGARAYYNVSRCRRPAHISSRSIGTAPRFMSWVIGPAPRAGSSAITPVRSARNPTHAKNWSRKWRARSSAPRSV
jgi:antirestriction protein ArdC